MKIKMKTLCRMLDVCNPYIVGSIIGIVFCQPKSGSIQAILAAGASLLLAASYYILMKYEAAQKAAIEYQVEWNSACRPPKGVNVWNRGITDTEEFKETNGISHSDIDTGHHLISLGQSQWGWEMSVYPRTGPHQSCFHKQLGEWDIYTVEKLAVKAYVKWCDEN